MRVRLSRLFPALTAAILALTAATAVSAAASPAQDPIPIGPNQYFTGLVNGHPPGQAVIYVVCPGPAYPGQTGPPLANQPVEVEMAAPTGTTDLGYTGSAGTSIRAALATPSSAIIIIASFTSYDVKEDIPTTIRVPCAGRGTVDFVPLPGSSTARTATLPVTFVNVAV